jgi:lipoprotein-releasing system ATP-binding protein
MILKAHGITKSYGSLKVLKGINMQIKKGEIISIVGASGAGKSTLLHILGTLDKPDNGIISINDTNVINMRSKTLAKFRNKYIGFVFQFHNLLPEFTAFENVCIPGYISKRNQKDVEHDARHLLNMLGLENRMNHKPSELSGGEQQRTAVARALINNPDIVFADEPSGNLDSKNANDLHQLFFELRKDLNQTFVIITHNEELAKMADRMLEMQDGVMLSE